MGIDFQDLISVDEMFGGRLLSIHNIRFLIKIMEQVIEAIKEDRFLEFKEEFFEKYGLLGSNKSTESTVKLFPRECTDLVEEIQKLVFEATGKHVEVMVYGDGAFKDPQGKIWELADPVVSPAHTDGLIGTPNELKLKYLADNDFKGLSGAELKEAISNSIKAKAGNLVGNMASQGTTPRQLTDLIGSLCDLTSGSGDKGTPIILVQGYFDNYTD